METNVQTLCELYVKLLGVTAEESTDIHGCWAKAVLEHAEGRLPQFQLERLQRLRLVCIDRKLGDARTAQRLLTDDKRRTHCRASIAGYLANAADLHLEHVCELLDVFRISLSPCFGAAFSKTDLDVLLKLEANADAHLYVRGLSSYIAASQMVEPVATKAFVRAFRLWKSIPSKDLDVLIPAPFSLLETLDPPTMSIQDLFGNPASDFQITRFKLGASAGRGSDSLFSGEAKTLAGGSDMPSFANLFEMTFQFCSTMTESQKRVLFQQIYTRSLNSCDAEFCDEDALTSDLSLCSKCKAVRYCSVECQKQDWGGHHKRFCRKAGQLIQDDIIQHGSAFYEVLLCVAGKVTFRLIGDSKRIKKPLNSQIIRVLTKEERLHLLSQVK
ncbi:hypothetical protein CcCBS67573_g01980 [Chytriomyces confervae]|uniref:MYND-type domain-containing protein n=1 Tax=Chytriomyces confervae TaxID=246404 RepID=A0A507FMT3_9FUNG|nr:hypothetical protein HDU80_004674 [Chytriomyces hyalinus]TPX76748.1 hypothetical protein CcCBS67573_g01980 [Chytriomyces confervae]